MCVYCEALTSEKFEAYKHKYRQMLPINVSSNDNNDWEAMANIIPPTPISLRQHQADGLTSLIEVYYADEKRRVSHIYLPIKYCPICGKEIAENSEYKSNTTEQAVLDGYVSRDGDEEESICITTKKPVRDEELKMWCGVTGEEICVESLKGFDNMSWHDEPVPVKITIQRK